MITLSLIAALTAHAAETTTLWKEYYLYSVSGKVAGYYEETAERRAGEKQLAVSQRWVEKEDGGSETWIGAVAKDDGKFTPVAFFSERTGPSLSYKIDGRVKGQSLTMNFTSGKPVPHSSQAKTKITPTTILSNFVPFLLAAKEPGKSSTFSAVVEDARDGKYLAREGKAEITAVKKEVKGHSCRKATVSFAGVSGEWWVATDGRLCEFSVSANNSKLELSTEAEAKKAFGK